MNKCFVSAASLFLYRQRLFENLRMLPHAPGVQMQAIPEDAVQEDSGDEEDDPDKRISSECHLYSFSYRILPNMETP